VESEDEAQSTASALVVAIRQAKVKSVKSPAGETVPAPAEAAGAVVNAKLLGGFQIESPPAAVRPLLPECDGGSSTDAFPLSTVPLSDYDYTSDGGEPYVRECVGNSLFYPPARADESESQSDALRSERYVATPLHDSSYAYSDDD
jgi:hypothetical protein